MKTIRLELARTPEYPTGNPNHGYEFVAPLDDSGHIDAEAWRRQRGSCTVRRFEPGKNEELGHLIHTKGRRWAFHYDTDSEFAEDEPGFRFDSHVFRPGEYVSITEHDGVTRPFKVVWVR
jgi:hypothetical protein